MNRSSIIVHDYRPSHYYEIGIVSSGYESRASFAIENLKEFSNTEKLLAVKFDGEPIHNTKENLKFFNSKNAEFVSYKNQIFKERLLSELHANENKSSLNIWIDISSLTRAHIAIIVESLKIFSEDKQIIIYSSFVYSNAIYSPPSGEIGPILHKGAVIPSLAGWRFDTELPNSIIFGIGYEPDLCMGLIESIEPSNVFVYSPYNSDVRYDIAINTANLWVDSDLEFNRIFKYKILNPIHTYNSMMSVLTGIVDHSRPIIIPFGPKIFALLSIVVGFILYPKISVWRVSSGIDIEKTDRIACGSIAKFMLQFN